MRLNLIFKYIGDSDNIMEVYEINMGMESCIQERQTANTIMICTRTVFMMDQQRDIDFDGYIATLLGSGSAGIIKE